MSAADQTMPEGTDHIIEGAGVGDEADDVEQTESDGRIGEETIFTPDEDPEELEDGPPQGTSGQAGSGDGGESAPRKPGEGGTSPNLFASIDAWRTDGFDKARDYAQQGLERATGALDDVVRMINDAADQIDDKVGSQYGGYARRAADSVGGFGDMLKGKDVDQLFEDAREIVRKSPAVAIGAAAALGFVVARLARAGVDVTEAATKPKSAA